MGVDKVELNRKFDSPAVSSPVETKKAELSYFSDKDEEILTPAEYSAKLQKENQEFDEAMQFAKLIRWYKNRAAHGSDTDITGLFSVKMADKNFSDKVAANIYKEAGEELSKAIEQYSNDNGSLDEQKVYELLMQQNKDLSEDEVEEIVNKIAINVNN